MTLLFQVIIVFSAFSFIVYGLLLISNKEMQQDFKRYKLDKFRKLSAILEILGGLGLLAGLFISPLLFVSSGGLILLMAAAVGARLRIKDPFLMILPAIFFLVLNLYIFLRALELR